MPYLDQGAQITGVAMAIVFPFVAVIVIAPIAMQLRAKLKAFEVLKIYAERGEEPPAAILDAVNQIGRHPAPPARKPSRGEHLTHVAGSVVLAIGAAGIAWWRAPEPHANPSSLMVFAVIVAIFFTAAAAARLVAALTTGDER